MSLLELVPAIVEALNKLDKIDMATLASTLAGISLAAMTMAYGAFQTADAARSQAVASIRAIPKISVDQARDLEAKIPDHGAVQGAVLRKLYWSVMCFLGSVAASLGIDPFVNYETKAEGSLQIDGALQHALAQLPFLSLDIGVQFGTFVAGCVLLFVAAGKLKGIIAA